MHKIGCQIRNALRLSFVGVAASRSFRVIMIPEEHARGKYGRDIVALDKLHVCVQLGIVLQKQLDHLRPHSVLEFKLGARDGLAAD